MLKNLMLLLAFQMASISLVSGAAVKDREGAVRSDRAAMEDNERWIYNDVQKGVAEARRSGKPLMVVLRCVPCLSCAGIDAQVLEESSLSPLLDQFVRVRLINANAIDLSRFQFDFDLSFSTLFFNADGTLYGRFGSWTHQKNPQEKDTSAFKHALEGALVIHKGYPANKASLTGKQGGPVPFRTPVDIPVLAEKYTYDLNWNGKVVKSCVHCHQIGDAFRLTYRNRNQPIPSRWIYAFPTPETVGMTLAPDQNAHVESVEPGSIAANAGLKAGDNIVSMAGQPLISIADVSWILHGAPEGGPIEAVVQRGSSSWTATLNLPAGWRSKSDISRRVGTWPMRGMATGGMVLVDLEDPERAVRGIGKEGLALFVKGLGRYGKHAAARKAGFRENDVIIQLAGVSQRQTEGEMIGHLLQNFNAGSSVKATVLRNGKRINLTLPMQ